MNRNYQPQIFLLQLRGEHGKPIAHARQRSSSDEDCSQALELKLGGARTGKAVEQAPDFKVFTTSPPYFKVQHA